MSFHVLYRYCEGDGDKLRPPFFSKGLAAASFVASLDQVPPGALGEVELHIDGPSCEFPPAIVDRFNVEFFDKAGNSASYARSIRWATEPRFHDADVVLLAEDDYLWTAQAVAELVGLFAENPELPAATPYDHPRYPSTPVLARYIARHRYATVRRGTTSWTPVPSTCMTYAARVGFLRHWYWLHNYVARGRVPRDTALWFAINGVAGFPAGHVLDRAPSLSTRRLSRAVLREIEGRLRGPRVWNLLGPQPGLATHMEQAFLSTGTDWAGLAAEIFDEHPEVRPSAGSFSAG